MATLNKKYIKGNGLKELKKNLMVEKTIRRKELDAGLRLGALHIQAKSQKLVPVDTGNLKASAFTRRESGLEPSYLIGYTAEYALFVHEMKMVNPGVERGGSNGKGRYWDPQGQAGPKFLEKPAREERNTVRQLVLSQMKGSVL